MQLLCCNTSPEYVAFMMPTAQPYVLRLPHCFVALPPHPPTPMKSLPWFLPSNETGSSRPRPSPFSSARTVLTPSTASAATCPLPTGPEFPNGGLLCTAVDLLLHSTLFTTGYQICFRKVSAQRNKNKSLDSRGSNFADHLTPPGPGSPWARSWSPLYRRSSSILSRLLGLWLECRCYASLPRVLSKSLRAAAITTVPPRRSSHLNLALHRNQVMSALIKQYVCLFLYQNGLGIAAAEWPN